MVRLLGRVAKGDQLAFGRFYDATSHRVFGMVVAVVVDRTRAESVTAAAYVSAWRQAPSFDERLLTPSDWLAAITGRELTAPSTHL